MNKLLRFSPGPVAGLILAALLAAPAFAQHTPADAQAALASVSDGLVFAENRGQWPDEVRFRARIGGADLWVTDDGVVYDFYVMEGDARALHAHFAPGAPEREGPETARRRGHVVEMRFEGARARRATGHGRQTAYHNYFLGDDPARWASHVPLFEEVVLEDLYAGVDLRLYSDGGLPRYDLVLAPGADLAQVWMRLDGADGVALTPEGSLRMDDDPGTGGAAGAAGLSGGRGRGARDGAERVPAGSGRDAGVRGRGDRPQPAPRD